MKKERKHYTAEEKVAILRRHLVGIFFMRPARRPQIEKPPVENWGLRESPHRSFPGSTLETCPTPAWPRKRFCMRPASRRLSCRTRSGHRSMSKHGRMS